MHTKPAGCFCGPDRFLAVIAAAAAGFLLAACSAAPSRETAARVIRDHFEGRRYRVMDLQLGKISSVPLNRMTYMGTPGNSIEIKRIVLEVLKDTGEYRRGQILTFADAVITIREKVDKKDQWSVVDVSGIPVP
ncbi:MAG TPA: hypothetical protein VEP69_01045 [Thermodesulfovibrionales bacterium]|nr:hypothetical protein [Thermodesulfovibrionales bacterium]